MTLHRGPDAKTSEEPVDIRRELLFFGLAILLLAAFIYTTGLARRTTAIRAEGQNLVRLHVIANSDGPGDQAVKLKVRDRILRDVGAELGSAADARQALEVVQAELGQIEALAEDELSKNGYSYGAAAMVGIFDFPDRTYGDLTLPAGRYNALRVVLGDGQGQNWWCVLFPPLCLVDLAVDVERPSEAASGAALAVFDSALAGAFSAEVFAALVAAVLPPTLVPTLALAFFFAAPEPCFWSTRRIASSSVIVSGERSSFKVALTLP